MIFKMPIPDEMRVNLLHAENLIIDLRQCPDVLDLKASAAEAHLQIRLLHSVIKSGDLRIATKVMTDWEESQCQS